MPFTRSGQWRNSDRWQNLKEHNLSVFIENIGFILRESYLFSDTIENNIGFAIDNPTKAFS